MRIMLLNPAHPAIGSRVPREHLPPLGLLAVGGALVDAGHEVRVVGHGMLLTRVRTAMRRSRSNGRCAARVRSPRQKHGTRRIEEVMRWK